MKKTTQAISYEGDGEYQVPDQLIEPGALSWDLNVAPILVAKTNNPKWEEDYLGKVTRIFREDSGLIMADIEWYKDEFETKNTTIFADGVEWDDIKAEDKELRWVAIAGKIRLVFTPDTDDGYRVPWTKIEEKV